MKVILDDREKTIEPVEPFTIKELESFADERKLEINKWKIVPPTEKGCCNNNSKTD